jgi:hypothetical protein
LDNFILSGVDACLWGSRDPPLTFFFQQERSPSPHSSLSPRFVLAEGFPAEPHTSQISHRSRLL